MHHVLAGDVADVSDSPDLHQDRPSAGPPSPLSRGRMKFYSAASTRFFRFDAAPRASTGLRNCPV
jgi:hypothetical protein